MRFNKLFIFSVLILLQSTYLVAQKEDAPNIITNQENPNPFKISEVKSETSLLRDFQTEEKDQKLKQPAYLHRYRLK